MVITNSKGSKDFKGLPRMKKRHKMIQKETKSKKSQRVSRANQERTNEEKEDKFCSEKNGFS